MLVMPLAMLECGSAVAAAELLSLLGRVPRLRAIFVLLFGLTIQNGDAWTPPAWSPIDRVMFRANRSANYELRCVCPCMKIGANLDG